MIMTLFAGKFNLETFQSINGLFNKYRYDPRFSNRYVCANCADPDKIPPRGAV